MSTCDNFQPISVKSIYLYHACMVTGDDEGTNCICILPIDKQDPEKGMLIMATNGHACLMITDTARPCAQAAAINVHHNKETMKLIKKSGVCIIETDTITIPVAKQQVRAALQIQSSLPTWWIDGMKRIFADYKVPDYYAEDCDCVAPSHSFSAPTIDLFCKIVQDHKSKEDPTKTFKMQQLTKKILDPKCTIPNPYILRTARNLSNLCMILVPATMKEEEWEGLNKDMDDTQKNILSALF